MNIAFSPRPTDPKSEGSGSQQAIEGAVKSQNLIASAKSTLYLSLYGENQTQTG